MESAIWSEATEAVESGEKRAELSDGTVLIVHEEIVFTIELPSWNSPGDGFYVHRVEMVDSSGVTVFDGWLHGEDGWLELDQFTAPE